MFFTSFLAILNRYSYYQIVNAKTGLVVAYPVLGDGQKISLVPLNLADTKQQWAISRAYLGMYENIIH